MMNDKNRRLNLPSKGSRGALPFSKRRRADEESARQRDGSEQRQGDDSIRDEENRGPRLRSGDGYREEENRRSRPRRDDAYRDEESRRSRPRRDDHYRSEDGDRYPDREDRRSRPRRDDATLDDDADGGWKRAEKNWKPPLESSGAGYRDDYDDYKGGSRPRSGDSRRSRPEYRDYHEYPEEAERRPSKTRNLPPQYEDFEDSDEPPRSSSSDRRRSRSEGYDGYDGAERTSSPSRSRSRYNEPEKTRPSLWGDESEEQPAFSPLWADDPMARREHSRRNGPPGRGSRGKSATFSQPKKWWNLPNFKDPLDRRRSVIWSVVAVFLIVSCVLPSLTFAGVFALYKHASALATEGVVQLEQGGNLMKELAAGKVESSVTSQALQSFQNAYSDFSQLQSIVRVLPGGVPKYGSEIASAQQLLPIAVEASQMAVLGTSALNLLLQGISNPFAKTGGGVSPGDMQTIQSDFSQVLALFNTVAGQIQQLSPASLSFNAKLGADIIKVKADLPKAQQYIQLADSAVKALPSLLGVGIPTNYMLEVLDSSELRPGGGFIGNYGTLTLSGGRIGKPSITDIDLLDRLPNTSPTVPIAFPPQYAWFAAAEEQTSWGMRDSNIEPDFPWDAQQALSMYKQEEPTAYDDYMGLYKNEHQYFPTPPQPYVNYSGVIAITPFLIEQIINITGPISVAAPQNVPPPPGNPSTTTVTVNASNMITDIHYYQLAAGHGSSYEIPPGSTTSARKAFTGALFTALMAKVVSLANTQRAAFVKVAVKALQTKDLQVYLGTATQASPAEAVLEKLNLASTLQAPATGDTLMIVDTNVAGNKQSIYLDNTATDNITIAANGDVTHTLTLTYNWPYSLASSINNYGDEYQYVDHIRVYAPIKSVLNSANQTGGYNGSYTYDACSLTPILTGYIPCTDPDGKLQVFSGDMNLYFQDVPGVTENVVQITYSWTVPGAAVKSGNTWDYQLLLQQQAGIVNWTQSTTITLPSCAKVTKLTQMKADKSSPDVVSVTGPLTQTTYAVEYTCAG